MIAHTLVLSTFACCAPPPATRPTDIRYPRTISSTNSGSSSTSLTLSSQPPRRVVAQAPAQRAPAWEPWQHQRREGPRPKRPPTPTPLTRQTLPSLSNFCSPVAFLTSRPTMADVDMLLVLSGHCWRGDHVPRIARDFETLGCLQPRTRSTD